MKKLLSISLLTVLTLGTLTACGNTSTTTTNELGLIEDGKIYAATNPTYAPFEYMDGTEMVGFDIDLLNEVAELAGLEVVYTALDFDLIIPAVQSGQYDLGMSGISVTEERKELILFGDAYYSSAQVALLPKASAITSVDELKDGILGAGLGTTGESVAETLSTDLTLVDTDVALPMLNAGQLDAYICDLGVAQNAVATGNYIMLEEKIQSEEMSMVFEKENEALAAELNKHLATFMETDEYQALLEKYGL
ncbi:MAG: transporter substrate-binding domain-containing protein [Lachnospirales bacterium]